MSSLGWNLPNWFPISIGAKPKSFTMVHKTPFVLPSLTSLATTFASLCFIYLFYSIFFDFPYAFSSLISKLYSCINFHSSLKYHLLYRISPEHHNRLLSTHSIPDPLTVHLCFFYDTLLFEVLQIAFIIWILKRTFYINLYLHIHLIDSIGATVYYLFHLLMWTMND